VQNNNKIVYSNVINIARSVENPSINVYPNPAKDNISIVLQGIAKNSVVDIRIYDATGKVVLQSKHTITQTSEVVPFQINSLATGVYHVQVRQANGSVLVQKWNKVD
jgi:hypothetical protein